MTVPSPEMLAQVQDLVDPMVESSTQLLPPLVLVQMLPPYTTVMSFMPSEEMAMSYQLLLPKKVVAKEAPLFVLIHM